MIIRFLLAIAFILNTNIYFSYGQTTKANEKEMQWFADAKLGIFIHWGIYSVNGIDESWSFFNNYISYDDYMKQLSGFTATKYDAYNWAKLIKESGAKYAVLTAKHHDGVALWDTKFSKLNVVEKTPAQKDVVAPFCDALRKNKLKVGLYYSLIDWSYPDYPAKTKTIKRYEQDSLRWNKFYDFYTSQVKELVTSYKPDLIWFDGDWEHSAAEWKSEKLRTNLKKWKQGIIINSRINGYGDYATPEQGIPINRPKDKYWELCMTMNDSWGYQPNDKNYKSLNQIIRLFSDCIGNGGNLLLDIGPKPDGSIPQEQIDILKGLGRWTKKHAEAIYGTSEALPAGYFYGPSTLSKDKKTLYLFLPYRPDKTIVLKGLKNKINRIRVVGNGTKLSHKVYSKAYWSSVPGIVYIDVPDYVLDEELTVIAVQLKGELDIYKEK
jgi:alpha-L-fucosidase